MIRESKHDEDKEFALCDCSRWDRMNGCNHIFVKESLGSYWCFERFVTWCPLKSWTLEDIILMRYHNRLPWHPVMIAVLNDAKENKRPISTDYIPPPKLPEGAIEIWNSECLWVWLEYGPIIVGEYYVCD